MYAAKIYQDICWSSSKIYQNILNLHEQTCNIGKRPERTFFLLTFCLLHAYNRNIYRLFMKYSMRALGLAKPVAPAYPPTCRSPTPPHEPSCLIPPRAGGDAATARSPAKRGGSLTWCVSCLPCPDGSRGKATLFHYSLFLGVKNPFQEPLGHVTAELLRSSPKPLPAGLSPSKRYGPSEATTPPWPHERHSESRGKGRGIDMEGSGGISGPFFFSGTYGGIRHSDFIKS